MTIHGGLRARALTLAALAAAFSPAHAQSPDPGSTRLILGFEQHFAPEENLEAVDVAEIATAGETVNLAAYEGLLPAFGVYVTRLRIGGRTFQAPRLP